MTKFTTYFTEGRSGARLMRKLFKRLGCLWHSLMHQGVRTELTAKEAKRVVLSNVLFVNTGLLILPLYVLHHLLGLPETGLIVVATGVLFIACSFINRIGHYESARVAMLTVAILAIACLSMLLGRDTMMHLLLISVAAYTLVLFEPHEKKWIGFFLVTCAFTWLALELTAFSLIPALYVSEVAEVSLYTAVIGTLAVTTMMCILHFVNSNAASERQLERQHKFLRSLIDLSPNFVFAKDFHGRYTLINKAMANAYGREPEDLVGTVDADFVPEPENARIYLNEDREVIESLREKRTPERCFLDIEGNIRWFLTVKRPIIEEDGSAEQLLGIAMDITDRKRAEQALVEREASFRDMAENVPGMIFQWHYRGDGSTRYTYVSQRVEEMFGLTATEVLEDEQSLISRIHPDDQENYRESLCKAISRRLPWRFEGRILNNRDDYIWCQGTSRPTSWDGNDLLFNGVIVDITERKRAQQVMEAALHDAQRANRTKSEFLANMSHEIRTPLNAVIGMTSLLLQTELTREQSDYCETVRTSGDALLTLISDILDFSKIESETLDLECRPFSLRECIEDSLDLLAEVATQKGLNLAYLMDPNVPPYIQGDDSRLRQVLANLISNAVKFTEAGEVFVQACVKSFHNGTYEILFAVSDTGIGIPDDKFGRLFKSFSQLDSSTSRRYGGTGLGLAISKKLVQLMGGDIWAESKVGRGSTFSFTIEAQPAEAPVEELIEPESLQDRRILIVDDLPTNRRILEQQALNWGMEPLMASSGAEALGIIQSVDSIDVGIVDLCMPEMDGLRFATELRRLPQGADVPLVLLTSLGDSEIKARAEEVGFNQCLHKPLKQSQLYDALVGTVSTHGSNKRLKSSSPTRKPVSRRAKTAYSAKILVAEDFVVNQKVAVHMLERLGYGADVAANGIEALVMLEKIRYDIILMDVHMPELDGIETARTIRARNGGEGGPYIIAMTANAMRGDREACLAAGMDDYLSKPVRLEDLEEALNEAVRRRLEKIKKSKPVPAETPGPLNDASFEKLVGTIGTDDVDVLQDIVHSFIANGAVLLQEMEEGLRDNKITKLQGGAHTLKSACSIFGAEKMAELCNIIEESCRIEGDAIDRNEINRLLSGADAEYHKVVDRLSAYVPAE